MPSPLLELRDLHVEFPLPQRPLYQRLTGGGKISAVDGVSLAVDHGEVLSIVGESGSGKSTLALSVMRLVKPSDGRILYDGQDIGRMHGRALLPFRRRAQMIFQDTQSFLNPRKTVARCLREALILRDVDADECTLRSIRLLERVGLDRSALARYPHELSGGQRQRVSIARALATEPEFLVADEPVSSLDVSLQAQIINLLLDLRTEFGLTILFISHDLALVARISDRVGVMYRGKIVEQGATVDVMFRPAHEYTRQLLNSIPGRIRSNRCSSVA